MRWRMPTSVPAFGTTFAALSDMTRIAAVCRLLPTARACAAVAGVFVLLIAGVALPDDTAGTSSLVRGPYAVGSTNMRVVQSIAAAGDDVLHSLMLGHASGGDERKAEFSAVLTHRDAAWITSVQVPETAALYGPASGAQLDVVSFVTFPEKTPTTPNRYAFPYANGRYGAFEDMLAPGESPEFPGSDERFPLVVIAHGSESHGLYDVAHAHWLASHGYIVAVLTYGDGRTALEDDPNFHIGYLRPLMTSRVIDSLLASPVFGPRIDTDNIGLAGHSYGGFTTLATTGGPFLGNTDTVYDSRVKAGVVTAPWVGGHYDGNDFHAFGANNAGLENITVPILCAFGPNDEVTLASFILPAMQRLSGPRYVIEMVGQKHIFEDASWDDRNNWELLFFNAYLKNDTEALALLASKTSMPGGNEDRQLFEYQRAP